MSKIERIGNIMESLDHLNDHQLALLEQGLMNMINRTGKKVIRAGEKSLNKGKIALRNKAIGAAKEVNALKNKVTLGAPPSNQILNKVNRTAQARSMVRGGSMYDNMVKKAALIKSKALQGKASQGLDINKTLQKKALEKAAQRPVVGKAAAWAKAHK